MSPELENAAHQAMYDGCCPKCRQPFSSCRCSVNRTFPRLYNQADLDAAVAAEREACALLAEEVRSVYAELEPSRGREAAFTIRSAIYARGTKPNAAVKDVPPDSSATATPSEASPLQRSDLNERTAQREFVECDTCRAKPGSPNLCRGCLSNRAAFSRLRDERDEAKAEVEAWRAKFSEGRDSVTISSLRAEVDDIATERDTLKVRLDEAVAQGRYYNTERDALKAEVERLALRADIDAGRAEYERVEAKARADRIEALEQQEQRRSRRIIEFCVEAADLLGLDASNWRDAQFDPVLRALKGLTAERDALKAKLAESEAVHGKLGEVEGRLMRERDEFKSALDMYANAWRREIGAQYRNKRHEIDALVLTTQMRIKERDEAQARVRGLEATLRELRESHVNDDGARVIDAALVKTGVTP